MEGSLGDKIDLQALHLSGTYCHNTGTRPPSCQAPRQPTNYENTYLELLVKIKVGIQIPYIYITDNLVCCI